MQFSQEDRRRIFGFYDPAIADYGTDDARSLRWTGEYQQLARFEVLAHAGDMSGASVLDMGCGFGDLYPFLIERFGKVDYLGIDINPAMIAVAREKYPHASFEAADFGQWSFDSAKGKKRFDFVLASGALSFKVANHRDIYFDYIKKMYEYAERALAFNMLDARYHIDDDMFAAYFPDELHAFCLGLGAQVELHDDYLQQDFTLYVCRP